MTTKFNMTISEVLKKEENGDYQAQQNQVKLNYLNDKHIEDADMSVNWNKQFIKDNNEAYSEQLISQRKARGVFIAQKEKDSINAIAFEYDLTVEEARLIYAYLYAEYHSYGFREVLQSVDEIIDLIVSIKKLNGI